MKSIRIQIDMLYKVNDEDLEGVLDHDSKFFESIENQFNKWEDIPTEKRTPIKFEIRTQVGDVEEDNPKDGVDATEE